MDEKHLQTFWRTASPSEIYSHLVQNLPHIPLSEESNFFFAKMLLKGLLINLCEQRNEGKLEGLSLRYIESLLVEETPSTILELAKVELNHRTSKDDLGLLLFGPLCRSLLVLGWNRNQTYSEQNALFKARLETARNLALLALGVQLKDL